MHYLAEVERRHLMQAVLVAAAIALLVTLVLANTGSLPGAESLGEWGELQRRFGMSTWTAYAVSFLVMAALTAGPVAFYSALIASGVGIAVAVVLSGMYWTIRSWTRRQVQAY